MAWIRKKIKVRKDLNKIQRQAVAQAVIDHIVERSQSGIDKRGKPFPGYSTEYVQSLDFRIAGKSAGDVDLTLSGEMLNSLKLLRDKKGEITIGFDKGDKDLNGKAEGNIKGTYGNKSPVRGRKRDFLGIQRKVLKNIQDQYDFRREDSDRIAQRLNRIRQLLNDDDS